MPRTKTAQRRYNERKAAYNNDTLRPMVEKWCRMCDDVKPSRDFYIRFDYDGLLSQYCRKCHMKDCKTRKQIKRKQNARNT